MKMSFYVKVPIWNLDSEMQDPIHLISVQLPLTKHAQKLLASSRALYHLLIFSNIAQLKGSQKSPLKKSSSQWDHVSVEPSDVEPRTLLSWLNQESGFRENH